MLQVDIDQTRLLATKLVDAGARIDDIDVRTSAAGLAAALPDWSGPSVIAQALAQAAEFTEGAYLRVADRYRQVGDPCATLTEIATEVVGMLPPDA